MQVQLADQTKPLVSTGEVLLEGEGAKLVLTLEVDEELVDAKLRLVPATGPVPTFSAPQIATDKGADLANITWVSADWGATRTLQRVQIGSIQNAADLRVRLQIARGASPWYSPPGPQSFALVANANGQPFTATLPNTVADRVMLEFLGSQLVVQPVQPVTIAAAPTFSFGAQARDITLKVQGKRQVFAFAGDVTEAVDVPELLAGLREQKLALVGPGVITLELLAGAAGLIGLAWEFVVDELLASFLRPAGPSVSLTLPWNGQAEAVMFRRASKQAARARVEGLDLVVQHEPLRERLVLVPADELLGEALGELLRPTLESGQRFELSTAQRLVGVSIWARALAEQVRIEATLHADDAGAPAPQALATTQVELSEPDYARQGPRWIELEFPTPVDVPAGPVWIVVGCEQGELAWFVGRPRPAAAGELRQRRNGGAWLTRADIDPQGWALVRVRALEQGELAAPMIELILRDRSTPEQTIPLSLDASGKLVWSADDPSDADAAGEVLLRVYSTVPTTLSLSELRLRHRLVDPPQDQPGDQLTT